MRTAKVADELAFTATATAAAAAGHYDGEIQQLATAARLVSQLFAGGAPARWATGTLSIAVGANSSASKLTQKFKPLDLRDAINNEPDNRRARDADPR